MPAQLCDAVRTATERRSLVKNSPGVSASADAPASYEIRTARVTLENGVVLAPTTRQMLEEAIGAIKYHKVIYSDWGFGAVDPMGRNLIINFYGPPGTGKTLTAEGLAGTLKLPYLHVGISELESKYVGETAKNITAVFKAAESQAALLFFDEADTLLGARLSSVTQGIDNEINAMRSTLLVELERFEGIVVFATNFAKNYDNAFVSRIRYNIEFSLPDHEARKQLWHRFLVPNIPLCEGRASLIDRCAGASDGLSGREIRTALRIALPRALRESPLAPKVHWDHINSALWDIRTAKKNVGHSEHMIDRTNDVEAARKLLKVDGQSR